MNTLRLLSLVAAATAGFAIPATAQNADGRPRSGSLTIRTGFMPDPQIMPVSAGGNIPAARVGAGCAGFIADDPDVRLVFITVARLPLILSVASRTDTVLAVRDPDGRWRCDDGGGVSGRNPSLRYDAPHTGEYLIWVGTHRPSRRARARLHISEVSSQ